MMIASSKRVVQLESTATQQGERIKNLEAAIGKKKLSESISMSSWYLEGWGMVDHSLETRVATLTEELALLKKYLGVKRCDQPATKKICRAKK